MADDPRKRIEELEARVRELSRLVEHLAEDHAQARPDATEAHQGLLHTARAAVDRARQTLVRDVRHGVDLAVGGPATEPLESRIGGIWIGRVAVVVLMTALVMGAALSSRWEVLGAPQKVGIGYGVALAFIVYGTFARGSRYLFPRTVLGAGLALLYFTTYAVFFVDAMQLFPSPSYALPSLLGCLLVILAIAHLRRSKAATGIALFLVYYTVILSCTTGATQQNAVYALATTAVLAIAAFSFHLVHRWMFLAWSAMAATYATYAFFFLTQPPSLHLDPEVYFWWSNGFLTLCYLLFTLTCIVDAHRGLHGARGRVALAALNSAVYFALTWPAVHSRYPAEDWMFLLGAAAVMGLLAAAAEWAGARRSHMAQLFAAKAILLVTIALQVLLPAPWFVFFLASECLVLTAFYLATGLVLLKVLDVALLAVTLGGTLITARQDDLIALGNYAVPANWFFCALIAALLFVAAILYERVPARRSPRLYGTQRRSTLAGTALDLAPGWIAQLHAAVAALALVMLLITGYGTRPQLPFYLGAAAVAVAVAALVFRTPQLDAAAVLLLLAAHACFNVLLLLKHDALVGQPNYLIYTMLLALFTFFMAWNWERYLFRTGSERSWEHHFTAAIPYLAAVFLSVTLLGQTMPPTVVPVAQNAFAALLVMAGAVTGYLSLSAAGLVGMAVAALYAGHLLLPVYVPEPRLLSNLMLVPAGMVVGHIVTERTVAAAAHRQVVSESEDSAVRFLLLVLATGVGLWGLQHCVPPAMLTLAWLGFAVALIVLGATFHSALYRWSAFAALVSAVVRAFAHDLLALPPVNQVVSFGLLGAVLLVISWLYSRFRRESPRSGAHPRQERSPDGPSATGR